MEVIRSNLVILVRMNTVTSTDGCDQRTYQCCYLIHSSCSFAAVQPALTDADADADESSASASAPTSPSLLCGTIPIVFKLALLCKAGLISVFAVHNSVVFQLALFCKAATVNQQLV